MIKSACSLVYHAVNLLSELLLAECVRHAIMFTLQKQRCCFDTSMVTTVALQLVPSSVHDSNVHGRNYQVSCYL